MIRVLYLWAIIVLTCLILAVTTVESSAHGLHLDDYDVHPIETLWIDEGMLALTEAFGWIIVYKDGDLNHSQLHMRRIYDEGIED